MHDCLQQDKCSTEFDAVMSDSERSLALKAERSLCAASLQLRACRHGCAASQQSVCWLTLSALWCAVDALRSGLEETAATVKEVNERINDTSYLDRLEEGVPPSK